MIGLRLLVGMVLGSTLWATVANADVECESWTDWTGVTHTKCHELADPWDSVNKMLEQQREQLNESAKRSYILPEQKSYESPSNPYPKPSWCYYNVNPYYCR